MLILHMTFVLSCSLCCLWFLHTKFVPCGRKSQRCWTVSVALTVIAMPTPLCLFCWHMAVKDLSLAPTARKCRLTASQRCLMALIVHVSKTSRKSSSSKHAKDVSLPLSVADLLLTTC